jgi:hypothetical protein
MMESFRYVGELFIEYLDPKKLTSLHGPWFYSFQDHTIRCSDGYTPIEAVESLNFMINLSGMKLQGQINYQSLLSRGAIQVTNNVIQILKSNTTVFIPLKRRLENDLSTTKRHKDFE